MTTEKSTSNYYVTNEEMEKEIEEYKETGEMSNRLGAMFIEIATKYANKGSFAGYTWKSDMIGEAVYTCVRYAHNFDPSKQKSSNPFAYFTQICYHSFIGFIKKQKKHSDIKNLCFNGADIIEENSERYINTAIDYENIKNM
jgi:hypothetical protein